MATNVVVPALGESVTEAVLLRWLKEDGDYVNADEPLLELETDKANVDIPASSSGALRHAKKAGETVQVGETVGRIDESAKPAPAAATTASAGQSAGATASPAPVASGNVSADDLRPSVRRLVEENHLDASAIPGTGPGGRIIKEDVLRQIESHGGANGQSQSVAPPSGTSQATAPAAPPAPPAKPPRVEQFSGPVEPPAPKIVPAAPSTPSPSTGLAALGAFDASGVKRVPLSKIRKRIAERLLQAQQNAAILTTVNEVDMSAVMALRAKYKERFSEVHGIGLGLMSFFARGVVMALREFPRVNAFIDGDDIVYHSYVNLGIAVSTDRGLTVPVLQHAQAMSFARIESEIKRLANAARDGKLGLNELSGATFSITNGGVFGSLLSTPILSPPESGILGMHAINRRPVAVGDKVEIRPMMYIALSYDHRLVDGRESVSFLVRLKESLEDPARLLLEI